VFNSRKHGLERVSPWGTVGKIPRLRGYPLVKGASNKRSFSEDRARYDHLSKELEPKGRRVIVGFHFPLKRELVGLEIRIEKSNVFKREKIN